MTRDHCNQFDMETKSGHGESLAETAKQNTELSHLCHEGEVLVSSAKIRPLFGLVALVSSFDLRLASFTARPWELHYVVMLNQRRGWTLSHCLDLSIQFDSSWMGLTSVDPFFKICGLKPWGICMLQMFFAKAHEFKGINSSTAGMNN